MKHPELKLPALHAVEDNANLGQIEGRGRNELRVTIGHRVLKPRGERNDHQDHLEKMVLNEKPLAIGQSDNLVPKGRQDRRGQKDNRDKLDRKIQTPSVLVDQNVATDHYERIDLSELREPTFQIEAIARPAEGVRGERTARPDRPARGEAGDRPPRGERSERPAASRVERTNRDAPSDRRPPTSSAPKKSSGFGAGIHDDDSFAFVDEPIEVHDDFDFVGESAPSDTNEETTSEFGEREARPRRRRGRSRRSGSRTNDSEASTDSRSNDEDRNEEDDDSSDFISKNSRIPSWQETIGTLVAVNMENHQRNQSQNRQPRGRGPRRDR